MTEVKLPWPPAMPKILAVTSAEHKFFAGILSDIVDLYEKNRTGDDIAFKVDNCARDYTANPLVQPLCCHFDADVGQTAEDLAVAVSTFRQQLFTLIVAMPGSSAVFIRPFVIHRGETQRRFWCVFRGTVSDTCVVM